MTILWNLCHNKVLFLSLFVDLEKKGTKTNTTGRRQTKREAEKSCRSFKEKKRGGRIESTEKTNCRFLKEIQTRRMLKGKYLLLFSNPSQVIKFI